jgi:rubrerythrin
MSADRTDLGLELPDGFDLGRLDRDGALEEAGVLTRGGFLAALGAGAGLALGLPASAEAALGRRDRDVLNYALGLEHLQAAFYSEAERTDAITGDARRAMRVVGPVERAHVQAFKSLLGRRAVKAPRYDFQGVTEENGAFLKTAVAFEDLAVAAYKAEAGKLRSNDVLASALGIHTVEARHAAWMRYLNGSQPAVSAFDEPRSRRQVNRVVAATGFIAARPRTSTRRRKPGFTG